MPLPKRSSSARIPSSQGNHDESEHDKSRAKQVPNPCTTTFTGNNSHDYNSRTERSQIRTRSQSNAPVETQAEPRRSRNDTLQGMGSVKDSTSKQPSSNNGDGIGSLVRAKSLRKPPNSATGPPTSFRMPTRIARSSTAMAPTQSSSSRDGSRHVSQKSASHESAAKGESRRRSSSMGSSGQRSSTSSYSNPPSIPQTPRAQSRPRPPSSSSHYSRRPTSANSASVPGHSIPRRPDFSTYQQRFDSPSKTPATNVNHPRISMEQARQHMHLLHLNILHSSADKTLAEYTESARRQLQAQHNDLQDLYATSLRLSRSVQEQRNLLALTRWTNGNIAVLERKLSTLCTILEEISRLTIPTINQDTMNAEQIAGAHKTGPYTQLTEQFSAWVSYVLEVWEDRDAAAEHESQGSEDVKDNKNFKSIEGLGDGIKAGVRQLTENVNALILRMEDIRAVPVPDVDIVQPAGSESSEKMSPTTPALLVEYAGTLLDCMAEELQLMREIEFEVVIGEKAWVDDRVRRAQADIDGGFSTPRSFRDVF